MKTMSIEVNKFDDWGKVVGTQTVEMTQAQIADVVGHAAQLIAVHRAVRRSSGDMEDIIAELDEAMYATDVMENIEAHVKQKPPHAHEAGDKVFVTSEQKLATVLDVYGDGVNGSCGDIRLDLCGNTSIDVIEPYDPITHGQFDHTFIPIKAEWKKAYGIAKDVPVRDEAADIAAIKTEEVSNPNAFKYQLLSRLKQDCEYYLGFGQRSKKHLWALDEAEQIQKMKELLAELPEKPEWITLADIEKYEAEMVSPVAQSTPE